MVTRPLPAAPADASAARPAVSLAAFLTRLIWLCILPLLLLATWLAIDKVQTLQAEYKQEAGHAAQNFASSIDRRLKARIDALNILALSPLVDAAERWPELYVEAQGFRQSLDSHVVFADAREPMQMLFNTRLPYGTRLPPLPRPEGFAAAPAAVLSGKPSVGDRFLAPLAAEPMIAIAVPALRQGKVSHVLLAIMETSQFQEIIDQTELPDGWALALVDSRGETIARRLPPGFDSHRDVDASGLFFVRSSVSPWSVVLEIPRDVYRAPLLSAIAILIMGLVTATLVALAGGTLAGRQLARAVAALEAPSGEPLPGIREIASARRRLDAAAAQRDADATALRESEARFASTFEQAAVGIALVAPDGRWLRVNRKLCAIIGYRQDDLLAKTFQDITHPDDLAADLDQVRRMLARDIDSYSMDKRYLRQDGSFVWAKLTVALIWRPDGEPDYFISVVEDIQARKEAEAALHQSEAQLHALAARLQAVREEERTRMAREVHDKLGQLLTGLTMDMAWLKKRLLQINDPDLRQAMGDKLVEVGQLTETMIHTVQQLASDLRPSILDNLGLASAIRFEAGRFEQRSDLPCALDLAPEMPPLEAKVATEVFRIFQEILTNIARHAGASRVTVRLAETGGSLVLEVHDDGRGITPEQQTDAHSLGLLGMRERAAQIGGQIALQGEPGRGTTVRVTVPV